MVLGAGSPLWFFAAYGLCQAVVPFAVHWHLRAPKRTLLVLLLGVIVVDAARYSTGIVPLGLLNLFFVWVLIQQFGFWYADGWFDRRSWWQLVLIGAGELGDAVAADDLGAVLPRHAGQPEPADPAAHRARSVAGLRLASAATRSVCADAHPRRHAPSSSRSEADS